MSESDNNGSGIEDTGDTGTDAPAQDAAPAADVVPPPAAAPQTFDADPGGKGDDIPSGPDAGSELHEEEDTRGDVPDTARHAAETATRGAAETGGPEAKAAGDDKGGKDTGAEAKDDAPEADAAPAPGTTGSSGTLNHGDEVSIDHDVRPGSSDDHGPAAATAGSGGETAGSGTAATTAETDDHGPAEPASEPADTGRPEAANKEPAAEDATTDGTEAAGDAADATAGGGTETGGPEADDHDDGTPGADGRDDAPADHEQVEDEDGAGGSEAGGEIPELREDKTRAVYDEMLAAKGAEPADQIQIPEPHVRPHTGDDAIEEALAGLPPTPPSSRPDLHPGGLPGAPADVTDPDAIAEAIDAARQPRYTPEQPASGETSGADTAGENDDPIDQPWKHDRTELDEATQAKLNELDRTPTDVKYDENTGRIEGGFADTERGGYIKGEVDQTNGTNVARIDWVQVDEDVRGHGLSTRLVQAFANESARQGVDRVDAHASSAGTLGAMRHVFGDEKVEFADFKALGDNHETRPGQGKEMLPMTPDQAQASLSQPRLREIVRMRTQRGQPLDDIDRTIYVRAKL